MIPLTSRRLFRLAVISCAVEWFVVGLMLSDVVDHGEGDQRSALRLINLALFLVLGLTSVVALWRREPGRTE